LIPTQADSQHESVVERAALYMAAASSVAVLFSIAVSQILLAGAFAALLFSRTRLRLPAVWLPLALFMAGTVLSLAVSGNPAAGMPQVRKFYVYLTLPVVYSVFRTTRQARRLVLCWAAAGTAGALYGITQFLLLVREAHQVGAVSYDYYLDHRITGFMGHWQTYSGEQMIVLLLVTAYLMFSPGARGWRLWAGLLAAIILGAAVVLGYTRGTWLGAACAGLYLVAAWRPRLLPLAPIAIAVVLLLNPGFIRNRFESGLEAGSRTDSSQHRIVCWRTGWEMIKAHPWFGVGPEMVGKEFLSYVPPDIPRPLPQGWYGHLHSIYIHYAAERGIPTMLALLALLLKMVADYGRALRRLTLGRSDARFLLHGGIAVVAGIMVSGVFELNLGDSEVLALFLAVMALGYVVVNPESRTSHSPAVDHRS
jgi:O-antigen ligase